MSFETISIIRQLPIINGFVQVPNNLEKNKSTVTIQTALDAGASVTRITAQSGPARLAGFKHGLQEWIEIPAVAWDCCADASPTISETIKDSIPSNRTTDWPDDTPDVPPPGEREWNEMPCEDCSGLRGPFDVFIPAGIHQCCRGEDNLASQFITVSPDGDCIWSGESIEGYTVTITLVEDGDSCYWQMTIACPDESVIWTGTKELGSSPQGDYTGTVGCGIVEVPIIAAGLFKIL
jgi:hypothetical protein